MTLAHQDHALQNQVLKPKENNLVMLICDQMYLLNSFIVSKILDKDECEQRPIKIKKKILH